MKKKILIFALCCIMLFGVFSISVYATDISSLSNLTFDIPKGFTASYGYGIFNVNGTYTFTATYGETFTNDFTSIYIGYSAKSSKSSNSVVFYNHETMLTSFKVADGVGFTVSFIDGEDITNSDLISWVLANEYTEPCNYTSVIIPPTHTEKGYTTFTCTDCGDTYIDNYVEPLGHTFTESTVGATCTSKGYTTYTCDCGFTYTEEGSAYGHTFTTTTVDPTCTKKGSITYTCVSCGHSYSESLPKLDHTFVDSRCSVCNALDPSYYLDSEDNILNAWDSVFKDFFSLFGSAQSVFFDGKSLTFLGILVLLSLGLGLSFLLISVIIKFIYSRG